MGTRNLICIFYKGRFMVAQYSQWDGYLEGQGWQILQFLLVPGNIQRLKAGMELITILDEDEVRELMEKHSYATVDIPGRYICQCGSVRNFSEAPRCYPPTLSRETGAKLLDIIASAKSDWFVPFELSLEFAMDSLYCEYCYCIDLDNDTFEIFGGHTEMLQSEDGKCTEQFRFAGVHPTAECMPLFLKAFAFEDLPKDLDDMLAKVKADNPGVVEYEVESDGNGDDEDAVDGVEPDAEQTDERVEVDK